MLHISRRVGETINIGDDVTVTVLGIKDNVVRLGFNAPQELKIYRQEIYLKMKQEAEALEDSNT